MKFNRESVLVSNEIHKWHKDGTPSPSHTPLCQWSLFLNLRRSNNFLSLISWHLMFVSHRRHHKQDLSLLWFLKDSGVSNHWHIRYGGRNRGGSTRVMVDLDVAVGMRVNILLDSSNCHWREVRPITWQANFVCISYISLRSTFHASGLCLP